MLGIVFTTTDEAAPYVTDHTSGRMDGLKEGQPVTIGGHLVVVTGKGKINAALATERLLRQQDPEAIVHTGSATALDDELTPGTLVGAAFVVEGDRVDLEAPTYPRMPLECPVDLSVEGTLVSQDHSPGPEADWSYWERLGDMRDSAGYAIAYVAAQHGTPCHIAKLVTHQRGEDIDEASVLRSKGADDLASFPQRVAEVRTESTN